ncbi:manganese catalase family protein [Rhodococcus oryzae]|uniref:Manganese catalase family protein n=2 Tax=Rhodococcus oryzae TaxID=2571143 RepID=A0ABY2RLV8_9NOCA|nr:manganese catalase family protein [Rhodococcus oryzae]
MFLHNKRMMYDVRVDQPNPAFAKMLLEQFGGPNGELAAAMRYFTQGWNEPDDQRRSMLLDIATEELSHLEMVAQSLVMLLKGSPSELVDQVEGNYLGDLLDGKMPDYVNLSLGSGLNLLGGGGPRLTDSMGAPWTAAYVDTLGQPAADLRSNVAAEARAKVTYERLIKCSDDAGVKDTLNFLMTREIAHQKIFEAALDSIEGNFPPGSLDGDEKLGHAYIAGDTGNGEGPSTEGFELAQQNSSWGFEFDSEPVKHASNQDIL